MAAEDNASIVKDVYESFNRKDFGRLASYATPDATASSVPFAAKGPFRDDFESWSKAFPDGRIEVKSLIAQGDQVVAEIVGRGTHTGTLSGPGGDIPATGRRAELQLAEVFRFRDGKIVELRYYFDAFSLFQQLGIGAPESATGVRGGAAESRQ
jgi:steroid delta-isomerase-like uncharacterized protein